jgi:DNA-binding response OmpR family regulator
MPSSKKRILCVDPNADTLEMVTILLSKRDGYEVVTARTLAEAMSLARSGRFDLYLLESRLPDGTGLDLCQRLRECDARAPILFYVATVSFTPQQVSDAGGQGHVNKLDGIEVLQRTIFRLLGEIAVP